MPANFERYVAATRNGKRGAKSQEIRAFLRRIGAKYVTEYELIRAAHVAAIELPRYREEFAAHIVPWRNSRGKPAFLWAGTPKLAKQMKEVSKNG